MALYALLGLLYFAVVNPMLEHVAPHGASEQWMTLLHHARHLLFVAISAVVLAWALRRHLVQKAAAEASAPAPARTGEAASATRHWFEIDLHTWHVRCSHDLTVLSQGLDCHDQHSLKCWLRCIHPAHRSRLHAAWRLYLQNEADSLQAMLRLREISGGYRWFQLVAHIGSRNDAEHRLLEGTLTELTNPALPLTHLFEQTTEGMIVTDSDTRIIATNRAFEHITGYKERHVLNRTPAVLSSGKHDAEFYRRMWNRIHRHGRWEGEIWNRRRDGTIYPEWMSIARIADVDGVPTNYVAVFSDLSRIKQSEETLYELANHDHLTQLPNRMRLQTELELLLQQKAGHQEPSLIALDVLRFKAVNDGLGFEHGDAALLQIAQRLRETVGAAGTVARSAGDRFLVLLFGDAEGDNPGEMAERILDRLKERLDVAGTSVFLHACAGIATYPADGTTASTLVTHANTALEAAKQRGPDTVLRYTAKLSNDSAASLRIETELRSTLEEDAFTLLYQPQVTLNNRSTTGVEALLRWPHSKGPDRTPGDFLLTAERARLLERIDEAVFRMAQRDAEALVADNPRLRIAVNLAATRLADPSLQEAVARMLEEWPLARDQLELEITEDALMQSPKAAAAALTQLRKLGVNLAIDDFGTGHASLSHLQNFPVDRLKIDRSFVTHVATSQRDQAICGAIIDVGHSLGLHVLAEGIETNAQARALAELDCDEGQGFLFGAPAPPMRPCLKGAGVTQA